MSPRFDFNSKAVLITGAGGGIGRALAIELARRGARLALADISTDGLAATQAALPAGSISHIYPIDVADEGAIKALPARIRGALDGLDVLINNAGVAQGGVFEAVSESDFARVIDINFWGVVRMTRAFLPMLREGHDARLVNLSSLYGLISPPGQVAYSSSKFAVRGFSNALAQELVGSSVGVTVVHPGGVRTEIATAARAPQGMPADEVAKQKAANGRLLRLSPERAAWIIADGIERRKRRVLVGSDAKFVAVLERLLPTAHMGILMRKYRKGT